MSPNAKGAMVLCHHALASFVFGVTRILIVYYFVLVLNQLNAAIDNINFLQLKGNPKKYIFSIHTISITVLKFFILSNKVYPLCVTLALTFDLVELSEAVFCIMFQKLHLLFLLLLA